MHVPVWAWLAAALAMLVLFGLAMSNASALKATGDTLHEFFHDARHFIGVPCH